MNTVIYKCQYMSNLVKHIEDNLSSNLDVGSVSCVGYISHAKLYRDFYNLTGYSVKEYIRKRRLSNALALIKSSDFSLADISYQCGYSSQQALCRAVKQTLNMTPLVYKSSDVYYFYPPYKGESIQSVTVSNETIPSTQCLCFYDSRLKGIENRAIETFFSKTIDYKGRIFGRNGNQDGNRFCYELYVTDTIRDYDVLKSFGFERLKTVAPLDSTFVSTTIKNDEQRINAAWDYLYHSWLQNSMFEYTGEPYYEEYIFRNGRVSKLKLYLPIKKREDETTIILVTNPDLCFVVAKSKGYHADHIASKTVIDYLSKFYPYIIKTSKEFYLHKDMDSCVSGVKINSKLRIKDENVENLNIAKGNYLVLTSSVMGDYDRYTELLLSFAANNSLTIDKKKIFAVYDTKSSFDHPKIRMYCPIKSDTK